MAIIDYAGFDPVFWLHHVQVDRLLAIWQALYPDSYVEPSKEPIGSAVLAEGADTDVNTPLRPFHSDTSGNFLTAASVRNVEDFGYSYPEIQHKTQSEVKAAVNALYAASAGKSISRRQTVDAQETEVAPLVAAGLSSDTPVESVPDPPATGNYTEWLSNIRVAKDAIEQAFFIHIFLGDFNPDPKLWSREPNLVGTHAIITPYVMHRHPNKTTIVTGQIPLTRRLRAHEQKGLLDLANETATKEYVTSNLHWRVTTVSFMECVDRSVEINAFFQMDDKDVPRDQVSDLKISVVTANVQAAKADDQFPVWGEFKVQTDVTNGRPAGLGIEDDV